jgi:hypothetical protein
MIVTTDGSSRCATDVTLHADGDVAAAVVFELFPVVLARTAATAAAATTTANPNTNP